MAIAALESKGAHVVTIQADVAEPEQVERALAVGAEIFRRAVLVVAGEDLTGIEAAAVARASDRAPRSCCCPS